MIDEILLDKESVSHVLSGDICIISKRLQKMKTIVTAS